MITYSSIGGSDRYPAPPRNLLCYKKKCGKWVKALEKYLDILDEKAYLPEDYHLDTFARLILKLPPRPASSQPYVNWLTNTTKTNTSGRGFSHVDFGNLARYEASKRLTWSSEGEARKYTRPFEKLGFTGRFPWCAAFIHWLLHQHQVKVPVPCKEYPPYSYALCESWQQMAIIKGWYRDNDGKFLPRVGVSGSLGAIAIALSFSVIKSSSLSLEVMDTKLNLSNQIAKTQSITQKLEGTVEKLEQSPSCNVPKEIKQELSETSQQITDLEVKTE